MPLSSVVTALLMTLHAFKTGPVEQTPQDLGIVHSEFLPQDQTVNQEVYKEILQCLLCSVRKKRQELWHGKSWLLHHDNAPVHNALSTRQFLAEKNITVLERPPYTPDLVLCDFFFFSKLKGAHFEGVEGHQEGRDDGPEGHPRRILPAVHRSVAEKAGKVH